MNRMPLLPGQIHPITKRWYAKDRTIYGVMLFHWGHSLRLRESYPDLEIVRDILMRM